MNRKLLTMKCCTNKWVEHECNDVVALKKYINREITTKFDNLNHPRLVTARDGNCIECCYLPDGTKLSQTYGVPLEKILAPLATIPDMNNAISTWQRDSITHTDKQEMSLMKYTEYSGNIIYENGTLNKVLFPGGYCSFEKGNNNPTFHYFTQDHLGNNRAVINEDGTVEQITHYYPFGGTFNDAGINPELQQYKYNGKELNRTLGLDMYDYGARQYFPALPMWDRIDPLCEKHYHLSPYAYCGNNPISRGDKDGKDWYYTNSGLFLGADNKITDNIIIRESNVKTLGNPSWQHNSPEYINTYLKDIELSVSAYSNIFTDILIRNGYDMLKTGSGKVEVAKTDFINFGERTNRASTEANSYAITTKIGNEKFNITAFINTSYDGTQNIFSTVSNVINVLGVHEYKGHGIYKINNSNKGHVRIYKMQIDDPSWKKITNELREHVRKRLNEVK